MPVIRKDTIDKVSSKSNSLAYKIILVMVIFLLACLGIGTLTWGGLVMLASAGLPVPTFALSQVMKVGFGVMALGWVFYLCFTGIQGEE